jgi:hypothetical protein
VIAYVARQTSKAVPQAALLMDNANYIELPINQATTIQLILQIKWTEDYRM